MNLIVFHIVSGQAFFTGAVLLILAAIAIVNSSLCLTRSRLPDNSK